MTSSRDANFSETPRVALLRAVERLDAPPCKPRDIPPPTSRASCPPRAASAPCALRGLDGLLDRLLARGARRLVLARGGDLVVLGGELRLELVQLRAHRELLRRLRPPLHLRLQRGHLGVALLDGAPPLGEELLQLGDLPVLLLALLLVGLLLLVHLRLQLLVLPLEPLDLLLLLVDLALQRAHQPLRLLRVVLRLLLLAVALVERLARVAQRVLRVLELPLQRRVVRVQVVVQLQLLVLVALRLDLVRLAPLRRVVVRVDAVLLLLVLAAEGGEVLLEVARALGERLDLLVLLRHLAALVVDLRLLLLELPLDVAHARLRSCLFFTSRSAMRSRCSAAVAPDSPMERRPAPLFISRRRSFIRSSTSSCASSRLFCCASRSCSTSARRSRSESISRWAASLPLARAASMARCSAASLRDFSLLSAATDARRALMRVLVSAAGSDKSASSGS